MVCAFYLSFFGTQSHLTAASWYSVGLSAASVGVQEGLSDGMLLACSLTHCSTFSQPQLGSMGLPTALLLQL